MNPNMHVKRHPLIKTLWAMRTLILFFVAMNFQMTAQIALVIEGFVALWTFGSKFFCPTMHRQMILIVS
jgi:hypothetical protein